VQRADDALREAFDTHRDAWADALDTAQQRADRASRAAVDRLRGNKKAIAGPVQSPLKRNLNGDLFTAMELLDGLTAAIETSSVPPR
jgi:hypothetical protein